MLSAGSLICCLVLFLSLLLYGPYRLSDSLFSGADGFSPVHVRRISFIFWSLRVWYRIWDTDATGWYRCCYSPLFCVCGCKNFLRLYSLVCLKWQIIQEMIRLGRILGVQVYALQKIDECRLDISSFKTSLRTLWDWEYSVKFVLRDFISPQNCKLMFCFCFLFFFFLLPTQ